jgi:hypothetical protein
MATKKTAAKQTPSAQPKQTAKANRALKSRPPETRAVKKGTRLSAIAAAARVLDETGRAMTCPELIAAMAAKGYWTSPGGKTPSATLYAAIHQEIKTKGADTRFRKTERGKFASTGVA